MQKSVLAAIAGVVVSGALGIGLVAASGNYSATDFPQFNAAPEASVKAEDNTKENEKKEATTVEVEGDKVDNLRTDANPDTNFCKKSNLPAGEGKADKGGTCLSVPIGEVAKNPVKVAILNAPRTIEEGKGFELKVQIEDKAGPLDLDGFTFDETGKAGKAFLEGPGELGKNGRPFMHCHLGITTLEKEGGLPGDKYDAAFSGVQGFKGDDLSVKVGGLNTGFYRGDVYCSQPGHAPLPTAKADFVQAFDSFEFEVK